MEQQVVQNGGNAPVPVGQAIMMKKEGDGYELVSGAEIATREAAGLKVISTNPADVAHFQAHLAEINHLAGDIADADDRLGEVGDRFGSFSGSVDEYADDSIADSREFGELAGQQERALAELKLLAPYLFREETINPVEHVPPIQKDQPETDLNGAAFATDVARDAALKIGREARAIGDQATALREFLPFAQMGDATFQVMVAWTYQSGVFFGANDPKNIRGNPEEALKWWLRAAYQGHPQALHHLATAYGSQGWGVPAPDLDPKKSLMWNCLAAAAKAPSTGDEAGDHHDAYQIVCASRARDYVIFGFAECHPERKEVLSPEDIIEAQKMARRWAEEHPEANLNMDALVVETVNQIRRRQFAAKEAGKAEREKFRVPYDPDEDDNQDEDDEDLHEEDVANWPGATGGNWT